MFSIVNMLSSKNTSIKVSYKDKAVYFIISSVVSTKGRTKEDVDLDLQFTTLNAYLDYKGDAFKEALFNVIQKSYDIVESYMTMPIELFPYQAIDSIIDMLDFDDILYFVKHVYKLPPPKHLQDVFEEKIERDARGSRDQTYLKDDYLELATLAIIVKATVGPICLYGKLKETQIRQEIKEYALFHFYRNNEKIYNYPPMVKLKKFIEKLIEQSDNGNFEEKKRTLEKGIATEETSVYLLGIVTIQKLATAILERDNEVKNTVTNIYNFVNSRLKATNSITKTIRDKEPMADIDSATGDKESFAESLRVYGDLSPGMAIEMDWAVDTVDKIMNQLPDNFKSVISQEVLKDAIVFTREFRTESIERCNIDFLSFIFKCIMDPRSMEYVRLDSIINLKAVGFAYLWGLGFKNLAVLLVSTSVPTVYDTVAINATMNKPRLSKDLKEQLDQLFPYRRNINDDTSENVAEKTVSELVKEYEAKNWRTLAYDKYVGDSAIVPPDLKVELVSFIIANEKMTYGG